VKQAAQQPSRTVGVRGQFIHFKSDMSPAQSGMHGVPASTALEVLPDGVMIIRDGLIHEFGPYSELGELYGQCAQRYYYPDRWIMPGFIDAHVHYVQTHVVASPGSSLLDWLNRYTFPAELQFEDRTHADEVAAYFLDTLLRHGVTSASVFASVHPQSCHALFEAAQARGMRIIAGKVLMDQNAPAALCDRPGAGLRESVDLIDRWHGVQRLRYSLTPRFVPTSSIEQLHATGEVYAAYPDVHLQTHVAENRQEVAWVKELFPTSRSYLSVYDQFGLLKPKTILAHGIWLDDEDWQLLAHTGAAIAFCPTSNLFLGSGLFDFSRACDFQVPVGLATDVGGGDSFSMFATMREAYKVCQLRGIATSALTHFYLATLGAARSLAIDQWVGNFEVGKEADFVVLNPRATPVLQARQDRSLHIEESLFVLMVLGDDRAIEAVHLMGQPVDIGDCA
jgi:guanine deaminase